MDGDIHVHSTCDPGLLFVSLRGSTGNYELQPDMLTVWPY